MIHRPSRPTAVRLRLLLPLAAVALGLVPAAPSGAVAAGGAGELPPIAVGDHLFHRRLLANGLVALAVEDRDPDAAGEATVSVFMVVAAGKRQESPATAGLAHLVEHALYTGTAATPAGEHDRRILALGGESNAFTREDYTLFYDHGLPPGALAEALAMEADRLRGLTFDEAAVLHERDRLTREEAETFTPAAARDELLDAVVFRAHPYGAGLLDAAGHTRAPELGVREIRRFYDLYYHPDRTAVVVAGAVEPGAALDAVAAAFGALPRGPEPPPLPGEPEPAPRGSMAVTSELARERVVHAWVGPEMGHPDRPALALLARLLSRRTLSDGSPVEAAMGDRLDRDLFRLAGSGPAAAAELTALEAEIRAEPPAAAEVDEIEALVADDYLSLPLRGRPYFSLAGEMGVYAALGHPNLPADWQPAVEAVTPQALTAAARRYLTPDDRFTLVFRASGEPPAPLPDDPKALQQAAEEAAAAGDLERAAEAYTRLLAGGPDRMWTVIYLASRGQVRMQQKDYAAAVADFEEALGVVDYPAVRSLLEEARRLGAGLQKPAEPASSPEP